MSFLFKKNERAYKSINNIVLQKSCGNEAGRLVPDFFLFFENVLHKIKDSVKNFSFNIFGGPRFGININL